MAERNTIEQAKRKLDAVNTYLEQLGSEMKLSYQGRNNYSNIDANSGRTISCGLSTKTLVEVARALDEVLYQVVRERKLKDNLKEESTKPKEVWTVTVIADDDTDPVPWSMCYGSEEEAKQAVYDEIKENAEVLDDDREPSRHWYEIDDGRFYQNNSIMAATYFVTKADLKR